jgi:DTW domain-containing protein YfiP
MARAVELPYTRTMCYTCRRPALVCVCADIRPVHTRFRIVILQHPQEARRTISTARIVTLSLPGSRHFVGVDFSSNRQLVECVTQPPGPVYLVYPERGAPEVGELHRRENGWPGVVPTFILIDGTWAQARKIKNQNPILGGLPRVALSPDRPSNYQIRKQPRPNCLCTVEAAELLLSRLEGPRSRYRPLLEAFERLVARQLAFKKRDPTRGVRAPSPAPAGE